MVRKILFVTAAFCLVAGAVCLTVYAQDKSATKPAAASAPASRPASVLATVGKAQITSELVDRVLAGAPAGVSEAQKATFRNDYRDKMIMQKLLVAYMDAKKVQAAPKDVEAMLAKVDLKAKTEGVTRQQWFESQGLTMDDLINNVRANQLFGEATTKEKVAAYIKAHPNYFDGSRVTASHILITCSPADPTDKVKAAHDELEKIAAEIQAGKIDFADAAKKYSKCPSASKGGDLGDFGFGPDPATGAGMVLSFCRAAYALKVGEVSPVFRTQFGWHIVKVTKRTAPATQPAQPDERVVQQAIGSEIEDQIIGQDLNDVPVVVKE